ncbi:L-histidine N(alpha)-methyltransferase [Winogradskyella litoriviva]|uniref:L-histidine N(Alpha)-methyltransferase n=1 Tax=Winogradskyella litoriviva TaxID=1220182 RepID=A0ABX2E5W2_9FLAO|nr:L-histidine N(alpha)-methyltransferase [Winogradskyella litoriviva]NRD23650.1 L-histidine N(alpha)-methyltransferase [Winogradskyella litoriviva]
MIEEFKEAVNKGLSAKNKNLPSKYFYDKKGDALFVEIMNLPEYYLTRAEYEIFKNQTLKIITSLNLKKDTYFELIELGAGDGTKTKELLKLLDKEAYDFDYFPIDFSQNALDNLDKTLQTEIPSLSVKTKQGDYFKVLESFKDSKHQKVILFLGSNIGNMTDDIANVFLQNLSASLALGDQLFLGVDLIKAKDIVLTAYNDSKGITAAFNLNLLNRINTELKGNFAINTFKHLPEYDEIEGIAKSFLVSTKDQDVFVEALNKSFHFYKDEKIHLEVSRKYNDDIINSIIAKTKFKISDKLTDSNNYFSNYILKIV